MRKLFPALAVLVASIASASEPPPGYLQLPGGRQVHKSCIYEAPNGGSVDEHHNILDADGKVVGHITKCPYPTLLAGSSQGATINNWVEHAEVAPVTISGLAYFNEIESTWYVPDPPYYTLFYTPNDYLWNGIMDANSGECCGSLLQPVLGWNEPGGGKYWSIEAGDYDGTFGSYVHSTPITVSSGEQIRGGTYIQSATSYRITVFSITQNKSTTLTVTFTPTNNYSKAYPAVLESYNVSTCQELPWDLGSAQAATVFTLTQLWQAGPAWNNFTDESTNWTNVSGIVDSSSGTPQCGYSVNINHTTKAYQLVY